MKFIIYIKDIIKKHRTKNLYFYLPIIAEARRKIRKNNTLLQIKAKKFFGPKVQSLIKENIAAKKISKNHSEPKNQENLGNVVIVFIRIRTQTHHY